MPNPDNQYIDTQTGNYIGYSRGSDAFSIAGSLASGAGKILTTATATADELIKQNIDEEARNKVEPIMQGAAGALETGQLSGIPDEVKGGLNKAEQLKMAKESGMLDESHYWNLLDAEARRLRAQHPGYKDYVDSRIASLTGANPANKLVQKLYDEQQALANTRLDSAQKELIYWQHKAVEEGVIANDQHVTQYTTQQLQSMVSRKTFYNANVKQREDQIKLKESEHKDVTNDVEFAASKQTQDIVTGAMSAGFDHPTIKPIMDNLVNSFNKATTGNPGDKIDIKNLDELRTYLGQAETSLRTEVSKVFTAPREGGKTWGTYLTADKIDSQIKKAMMPFQILKDAILDKDVGTVGALQNRIKTVEEGDQRNAYGMSEFARYAALAKNVAGAQWPSLSGLTGELAKKANDGAVFLDGVVDSMKDNKGSLNKTFQKFGDNGDVKPAMYNATVQRHIDNMRTADPSSNAFKASANYFFQKDNDGLLATIDPETGKVDKNFKYPDQLYQKMMDPVVALQMSKADPKTRQMYVRFAENNFGPLMKSAFDTAQNVMVSVPNMKVEWNPDTQQLGLVSRQGFDRPVLFGVAGGSQRMVNSISDTLALTQGQGSINEINNVLAGLKSSYRAQGMTDQQINTKLTETMNKMINFNTAPRGSILDQVMGVFKKEQMKDAEPAVAPKNTERLGDANTLQNIPTRSVGSRVPSTPSEPTSRVPQSAGEPTPEQRNFEQMVLQNHPEALFDHSGQNRPAIARDQQGVWRHIWRTKDGNYVLGDRANPNTRDIIQPNQ